MNCQTTPYIGITGFMNCEDVEFLLEKIGPYESGRQFMVGVLANGPTLQGKLPRQPRRYPALSEAANIFVKHPATLNLIHYNSGKANLCEQLCQITEVVGTDNFDGFQLNIVWPALDELRSWRELYPEKRLVLQVSRKAYQAVGKYPKHLAKKIEDYVALVTDVLFDLSGGRGNLLDAEKARKALTELRQHFGEKLGLAVAGGLGPDTLVHVSELLEEFPNLSIDAEGRLRDETTDDLDLEKAKAYLCGAFEMMKSTPVAR